MYRFKGMIRSLARAQTCTIRVRDREHFRSGLTLIGCLRVLPEGKVPPLDCEVVGIPSLIVAPPIFKLRTYQQVAVTNAIQEMQSSKSCQKDAAIQIETDNRDRKRVGPRFLKG